MPPRDLNELDESEARAFLDEYVGAARERLAWLERTLAATGGPPPEALDRSPESLVRLWRWFVSRHDRGMPDGDEPGGVPMWYEVDPPGRRALGPPVLWAVDGIGYYLADVLLANVEGVAWTVAESPKRLRLDDRNKPVLAGPSGAHLSPVEIAYTGAAKVAFFGTGREDDHLLGVYRIWASKLHGGKAA